jgi:predicted transposase YbfD/YdcC
MKRNQLLSIEKLQKIVVTIPEKRRISYGNYRHRLSDVLTLCLLAVVCGCETFREIHLFGMAKREFMGKYLILGSGIPSITSLRRILGSIEPVELETAYRRWVAPYLGTCLGKQICVDGKTLCGASTAEAKLHLVSAWVREDGITMGQTRTHAKSNEIKAIPALLNDLSIQHSIVTIDAMGCQKNIAETILGKQANYLLAVKGNQPTLFEEIQDYFNWALEDPVEQHHLDEYHETDYEHGRTVHYHVVSTQEIVWFEDIHDWAGLKTFVMVQRTRQSKDVTSTEKAYYISSLEADAKSFAQWTRGHWGIENALHWVLDVQFHEDACKIHEGNAPENLSILRKMAKNLLGRAKTKADSFRSLQLRAGWDNDFLFRIIT